MDAAPFHKLALAEVDAVHRLAFHLCRSHHEAEELVQETYLRAVRSADSFTLGDAGVRPWLFTILHNVLHTRRVKDRRERLLLRAARAPGIPDSSAPPEQPAAAAGSPSVAGGGPSTLVDWDQLDERLCRAIRGLPVPHRTVFLLSAVEDLKYREIAAVVGCPVGTVMSRLARARAALAGQLRDVAADHNMNRPGHRGGRREPRPHSSVAVEP